jgi:hypothetical protein
MNAVAEVMIHSVHGGNPRRSDHPLILARTTITSLKAMGKTQATIQYISAATLRVT